MHIKIIFIIILLTLYFLLLHNKQENLVPSTSGSNEALNNIASVYANTTGTISMNNLNATGNTSLNTLNVTGNTTLNGGKLNNMGLCDQSGRYCAYINRVGNGYGLVLYDTNSDGRGTWENATLNIGSPNISTPVITNPSITSPTITGGSLQGSALMDSSGRYGLFVNTVWNGNYGIRMYDTNSDGKNTNNWAAMPTRISEGQLGHANTYISSLVYKSDQDATGNGNAGARSWYVGNGPSDVERPLCTQFFRDYCQ